MTLITPSCGDCQYFQDNGLLQCPCDKHEQYVYRKAPICDDFKVKRGQRAKCDFIQDGVDQEIVDEIVKPFDIKPLATANLTGATTEKWVEMCNQTKYISDWDEAATPEICRTCKKNPHNNKCPWKDVAYGVWACYEEEDNLCLSCEHCNIHGECRFTEKPKKDINDRCCKFSRRTD